jgi:hypothetical protein
MLTRIPGDTSTYFGASSIMPPMKVRAAFK